MTEYVCNDRGKNTSLVGSGLRRLPKAWHWIRQERRSLLILCYHGVSQSDEHIWDPRLYIHRDVFRRRLETIRDFGYQVLPLGEAFERLKENRLSGPTAVLTFDDGWHDFYSVAWPILQEFQFPATVYQTSYYSQYNRPVFDTVCRYLLWRGKGRVIREGTWAAGFPALDLTSDLAVHAATQFLFSEAHKRGFSGERKDQLLQDLARAVGANYDSILSSRKLHLMNAAEIGQVSASGIDVQLHTHRHRLPADRQLFFRELEENRAWIEAASKTSARHFCYPNGAHRPELVSWLREAGVGCATTCQPGVATRRSEPMLLPRFTDANSISQAKFESWLTGMGRIAPTCRRVLRFGSAFAQRPSTSPHQLTSRPGKEPAVDALRTWA